MIKRIKKWFRVRAIRREHEAYKAAVQRAQATSYEEKVASGYIVEGQSRDIRKFPKRSLGAHLYTVEYHDPANSSSPSQHVYNEAGEIQGVTITDHTVK